MLRTMTVIAAPVLAALLTLTACGDENSSPEGADAAFNNADVAFATEMIPHHQQAVEMAELAAERADSPEVRRLAEDIEAAQEPEIQTMRQWLQDWGQPAPSAATDHSAMGHGGPDEMPGMMDAAEIERLAQADGAAFDEMFLQMMMEHHEGAIEMARAEQTNGENPDAITLAEQIEADQQAEIATMRQLLSS